MVPIGNAHQTLFQAPGILYTEHSSILDPSAIYTSPIQRVEYARETLLASSDRHTNPGVLAEKVATIQHSVSGRIR